MESVSNFTFREPKPSLPDYIQMFYLSIIFFFGVPLNFYTFLKLSQRYRTTKSRIILLSLHLNSSDLMILFFFALAKVGWLVTYRWTAGVLMCKVMKFAQTFSFTLSSNIVVCIGLDRLISLMQPLQVKITANRRCKRILSAAWLLAMVCSIPQFYTWTVFDVTPSWSQCIDIWNYWTVHNVSNEHAMFAKKVYNGFHIIVVFWLPMFVVIICYTIMLRMIFRSLREVTQPLLGVPRHLSVCRTSTSSYKQNSRSPTRVTFENDFDNSPCNSPSPNAFRNRRMSVVALRRNGGRSNIKRTKYKTLKVTVFIVLAYLICWLPYNIVALWGLLDNETYSLFSYYIYGFHGLMVVNVLINPLIYTNFTSSSKRIEVCR